MSNKAVTYFLGAIVILLHIVFFAAQKFVFSSSEPIVNQLNNIVQYAQQEKWDEAQKAVKTVIQTWEKGKYVLGLNYAEADYSMILDNLARLQGAIKTKDETETVSLALSTLRLWDNFIKVIPQP